MGTCPNKVDVVRRVADEQPALFRVAHVEGHPQRYDFIKLLAAVLHAEDARFGLNGKRGNPSDLSMDVITFRVGPTDRHCEAFDVIGAAGGPNPQPGWSDITNYDTIGQPGTAIWIPPEGAPVQPPVTPPPVSPPVTPPPTPTPPVAEFGAILDAIRGELAALRAEVAEAKGHAATAAAEALNAAARASDIKDTLAKGAAIEGRITLSTSGGGLRDVRATFDVTNRG